MPDPTPSPDLLQTFLATRPCACPACRYDLKFVATNTCPECGTHLELTLRGDSFYRRWLPLLIVAMVLPGLFGLYQLWTQWSAFASSLSGSPGLAVWPWYWYWYIAYSLFSGIAHSLAAHWTWRIRHRPPPRGWLNPYAIFIGLSLLQLVFWLLTTGIMWIVGLF